jgi:hypothetical protein
VFLEPPKVQQIIVTPVYGHDETRVPLGKRVRVQCTAQGHPYPLFSFSFRPWANPSSRRQFPDNFDHNNSYHIIDSFQPQDQGTYICFALNEIRDQPYVDSRNVTLMLQGMILFL